MFALRFLAISILLAPVLSRALVPDNATRRNSGSPRPKEDLDDVNCHCDDLCPAYNDCCPVFTPDVKPSTDIVQLPAEVLTCRHFRSRNNSDDSADDYIYVVSRCPDSYGVEYIRQSCELSESSFEPFYRLPVNGNSSGILYGNVYCAVCNGEPEVVFWTVRKELSHKSERLIPTNNVTDGHFVFLNPDDHQMRSCEFLTPTQSCGLNDSSGETKTEKCLDRSRLSLYSYEYRKLDLIQSQPIPVCDVNYSQSEKFLTLLLGLGSESQSRLKTNKSFPSYSIIFDLNSKSIRANENGINEASDQSTHATMSECDQGMLYDPFAEVCRQIYCRSGFRITHSGCVLINITHGLEQQYPVQANRSSYTEIPDCGKMVRLDDSEFTMLNNDSAFVYKTGTSYSSEEYLHDPPYLYICSNVIDKHRNETVYDNVSVFHFDTVQSIASFVGILISLVALSIQFVIYMMFPVLRNTPGKCVVCLVLSIFSGQLSFLFVPYTGPVCRYLAAFMHFAILASFCWMNVLALDISRTFASKIVTSRPGSRSNRFLVYSVYAWFVPATIVGLCLVMDILELDVSFRPYYGEGVCWITSRMGLVVFFLGPVAAILVSNFILFGITVFCLRRSSQVSETAVEKRRSKGQLILYFKLSVIMGLTWAFGFIATMTQWTVMWYLFILFNTLQGAFLCLAFVCTKNVLHLMKSRTSLVSRSSLSSKNRTRETCSLKHAI